MSGFDLKSYLARFPEVCQRKFRRKYSFGALEKKFESLGAGKRWLAAKDVLNLFDPAHTPFERYWQKPNEKELDAVLARERILLGPDVDDRWLVERLLGTLHNLGHVSLVLRFAHRLRFGIFSTPVMNLLQTHRPHTVEVYLAYCEELRAWCEHFRMASVAETESALWTYHELAAEESASGTDAPLRSGFDSDIWVQRRRAAQVLRPFLENYGPLELARILAELDPKLAGKIAGEEAERLLRVACRKFYGTKFLDRKGAAEALIERLANDQFLSLPDRTILRRIWKIRNEAVHPEGSPSAEQIENMIDAIERICRPWES